MTRQQPTLPSRQREHPGWLRGWSGARHTGVPALLFLALVLLFPAGAAALGTAPADGSTLDTSHMTTAQKVQAHLEGQAVISLVGLILCFAGGACLAVMARRDLRFALKHGSRRSLPVAAPRAVIPINSYRATSAALRSARLAEAAVTFGLAEPDKPGACDPGETDRLLDRLLKIAG